MLSPKGSPYPTRPQKMLQRTMRSWERKPFGDAVVTPLRDRHVPFDTPGLDGSASPVDSFGSAPARLDGRLTTFPASLPRSHRVRLLLSDGVRSPLLTTLAFYALQGFSETPTDCSALTMRRPIHRTHGTAQLLPSAL